MRKFMYFIFLAVGIIFGIFGIATAQLYLTAIPIGLAFGFFLQKGDLCASSAMSEALMFKDRTKLWGFWVAVVTTMLSLSVIDYLGIISVNPKPFMWLSSIFGGLIFGVGMVLAGGCVSGVLYKSGTGNINSIMALMGVPFGVAAVELGPLHNLHLWLKSFIIKGDGGEALTLFSVTGIPYIILAIFFVIATIVYALLKRKKLHFAIPMTKPWKPWIAGVALGLLAIFAYITSDAGGRNYPLGTTHGVYQYSLAIFEKADNINYVTAKPDKDKVEIKNREVSAAKAIKAPQKKINVWLVLLVLSLIAGSWMSASLAGQARLLPKAPGQTLGALIGGLMIGAGAAFAGGCSIGNIMSGWGMMSLGNVIFGFTVLLANWATTYFYLMGGQNGGRAK